MAKLTKRQTELHLQALELLKKDKLTNTEIEFVFNNYHEAATNLNGKAGAFFTPDRLAWEFSFVAGAGFAGSETFIDLCAGIGALAYNILIRDPSAKVVCVEFNPEFVEIGKKLVPGAEWHCADVTDLDFIKSLGRFDVAVSNPPFGAVATFKGKKSPRYTGKNAEYKVMDIASEIAQRGAFIIPQQSAGFKVSGQSDNEFDLDNKELKKFKTQTDIEPYCDHALDTCCEDYGSFKDVNVIVEFVSCDFSELGRCTNEDEEQQPIEEFQLELFAA